jgi:zinc protease
MKTRIGGVICLLLAACATLTAQIDRTHVPPPGPAPAVAFPDYTVLTTANGIRVIVVEDTELPTIRIQLLIDRKPAVEGEETGIIGITGEMLRQGTATRTKDQLDEEIDQLGGSVSTGGTSASATGLSKYTEKLAELLADVVLHPVFPQAELEKIVAQQVSNLKYRKTEPNAVVDVVRRKQLYGEKHPYGEITTEETLGRITRDKCRALYEKYFKADHAIIAMVGDITKEKGKALVEKYFGAWKGGALPEQVFPAPPAIDRTCIAMVDRPPSVQSVIRVCQSVALQRTSPDVTPVEVMNTVLGGGIFRLFVNLREKHAYTYGAYSSMGPDELIGAFTASTSVRNVVTDSALTEIFYEIRRIRDERVEEKELQMAKNYLSGSFVRSLEDASTIADRAIEIERHHLGKDYYKTYLTRVDATTAADVQRVAQKYLAPESMLIALVGSAKEVNTKIGKFGPVLMFDEDGNPAVEKTPTPAGLTPETIFAKYIEATGGKARYAALRDRTVEYTGKMATFPMKLKVVQKAPNKLYQEMTITGMMEQKTGYDGKNAWATMPQGVIDLTGEQLTSMKREAQLRFYEAYKNLGLTAAVAGIKEIKGKKYYEVTFADTSGVVLAHYFGVDDALKARDVQWMTTPQGKAEQSTDYFDYKDFDGIRIPTRFEQNVMGQTLVFALEKVSTNTGVADTIFGKPAGK